MREVDEAFARELHAMLTSLVQRAPRFADLRSRGLADDLVQDTMLAVTRRIEQGPPIDDPLRYAARCVENLACRVHLREREHAVGDEVMERLAPAVADVAEHVEQRMAMGEVLDMVRAVNGVLADLPPLELELVRAELARTDQKKLAARLGISRPTLYRRKGPAVAAFVGAVAARAGTAPCAEHAGALLAAAGGSGFDGARAAVAHAAGCEGCRETIRHLAVARHGLAIIAPIPLAAGHDGTGRILERAHAALDGMADALRVWVLRVGDPMPLGGSATKTWAVVAATCAGGGGLTCVVGLPVQARDPAPRAEQAGAGHRRPARVSLRTVHSVAPTGLAAAQVTAVVRAVDREEARRRQAAGAARARARRRAAAAATRRRREQAAREFAARTARSTAASREFASRSVASTPRTREFAAPRGGTAPTPTIARREFTAPAPAPARAATPAPAAREFGAP